MIKPKLQEFTNEDQLVVEAEKLLNMGHEGEAMYVLSHDDDRSKRVAKRAGVSTIGFSEVGISTATENLFHKKGDEIRNNLNELGFSQAEAESLEERLDQGKIFLMIER
ncbi:general stress protein [Hazenella sp. IB182357]|uniref:General stress protein n=1 Tax=Polycladospora coralii TaxID=2771432 RepID=A0A926NA38_9BACL|nr:general stress protein [Polycladospora coralii]MBD1372608.1 general stress protein [Polycladospora coralii]MBS7531285.1 general stress protein [Polycladospora coralii]